MNAPTPNDSADRDLQALRRMGAVLDQERVDYAVIGGVSALEFSTQPVEPSIEIAVGSYLTIPIPALLSAGFEPLNHPRANHAWMAPSDTSPADRSTIQFVANEVGLLWIVDRARTVDLGGFRLRLGRPDDLALLELAGVRRRAPWGRADPVRPPFGPPRGGGDP